MQIDHRYELKDILLFYRNYRISGTLLGYKPELEKKRNEKPNVVCSVLDGKKDFTPRLGRRE